MATLADRRIFTSSNKQTLKTNDNKLLKTKIMKKIILFAAALVSFSAATFAQATSSANQNVALSLANTISITFVSTGTNTGTAVSIPFTTVADYTNGVQTSAQQLKVQSNKPFNVTVNANAANFTYSGTTTPAPVMPVSGVLGLEVSANGTGGSIASPFSASAFSTLTSAAQNLINTATAGGNQTFSVIYQATPGFSYPAGTYTTNVVYTATQP